MSKVTLNVYGMTVLVDADQVDYHLDKDAAVRMAMHINNIKNKSDGEKALMDKMMRKIRRLNKKIRSNVEVVR